MRKILVVDDSAIVTAVIGKYLHENGYVVEVMNTPFGVSNKIREYKPHLVLMDLNMPGLRGENLLSLFRNKEENRFRIVVVSSEEESELKTLISNGLADDYFIKGTSLENLGRKINAQLAFVKVPPLHDKQISGTHP